jgi:hypothetical protein
VRYGGGVSGMRRWHRRAKGKRAMAPNQNRQDEGDATMTSQEKLKGREEVATQERTLTIDAGGAKKGCDKSTATNNKKIPTLLDNTIFLAPLLESAQAKRRRPYL